MLDVSACRTGLSDFHPDRGRTLPLTERWKGIFATIAKPVQAGGSFPPRYDWFACSTPIRLNGFEPDERWFGSIPEIGLVGVIYAGG